MKMVNDSEKRKSNEYYGKCDVIKWMKHIILTMSKKVSNHSIKMKLSFMNEQMKGIRQQLIKLKWNRVSNRMAALKKAKPVANIPNIWCVEVPAES